VGWNVDLIEKDSNWDTALAVHGWKGGVVVWLLWFWPTTGLEAPGPLAHRERLAFQRSVG